jgi:hypothetical protein
MPSTTRYKRGDVVLVPFPFTDLSSSKRRPALVISPDAFNDQMEDVVVAAIRNASKPGVQVQIGYSPTVAKTRRIPARRQYQLKPEIIDRFRIVSDASRASRRLPLGDARFGSIKSTRLQGGFAVGDSVYLICTVSRVNLYGVVGPTAPLGPAQGASEGN